MLRVNVGDDILAERRPEMEAFERAVGTAGTARVVSNALQAYALMAASVASGAVRRIPHGGGNRPAMSSRVRRHD